LGVKEFWEEVSYRLPINRLARHTQIFFGGRIRENEAECLRVFEIFQVPDGNSDVELVNNASVQPDIFPQPTALLAG
jgi:hypothetical protein